jgi:hypothetical protein
MTASSRVKAANLSARLDIELLEGRALPSALIGLPIVVEVEIVVPAQHGTPPRRPVIELVPLGSPLAVSGGTIVTSGVHSGYSYGNGTGIGWAWATYTVAPASGGSTTPPAEHPSTKHHKHTHHATSTFLGAPLEQLVTSHAGESHSPTTPSSGASINIPLSSPRGSKVPAPVSSNLSVTTASVNTSHHDEWWEATGAWVG